MTENDDTLAREPEELDPAAERRWQMIADAAGLAAERMVVLTDSTGTLPLTGVTTRFFKVADPRTGDSARVALDTQDRPVDLDQLLAAEDAAVQERYGAIQPALHELLERADNGDSGRVLPVVVAYAVDEETEGRDKLDLGDTGLDDAVFAEMSKVAAKQRAKVAKRAAAVHAETMRNLGVEVTGEASEAREATGPFIRVDLTADAIRRLGREPNVAFVGLSGEREIADFPTITESLPTTRTEVVHSTGVRGAGVRIAVLESGTPNVAANNFRIIATQDNGQAANDHMTKSLGIIGNRFSGRWEGYAPEADVLLANANDYTDRYAWARDRDVNVVTMSWHFGAEETSGSLHSRDVYFDYWAKRFPYPSIFTSAGNEADDAFSSGKGFNFMGVGNVLNDGDGDRSNDAISSSSSWKNPTSAHGDHEVPAIAAPGSRHELLGSTFGGTSAATPVAASIAALLMSRNANLKIWPEAIRAVMLATANYQRSDSADYSRFSDGRDGAGLVNSLYGMWTAGRRESGGKAQFRAHDYGLATAQDFRGGYFTRTWTARVSTTASRLRVALAWNSKTLSFFGIPLASTLDADLDLHVFDPNGNLVATGSSWDNSWELVDFAPRQTGDYTIKVRGFSVPDNFSSWFGVAWTAHYDVP